MGLFNGNQTQRNPNMDEDVDYRVNMGGGNSAPGIGSTLGNAALGMAPAAVGSALAPAAVTGAATGIGTAGNLILPGIGAAAGLITGLIGASNERKRQEKEGKIRAAEITASPWTKIAPSSQINFAAPTAGKVIGGLGAGLGMGQNLQNSMQVNPWDELAKKRLLEKGIT